MLRIDNLSKRYGDHRLFEALTHTFPPGCVALCEEDSTGKSSLLGIIAGVIAPDGGDVWIDGHSLTQTCSQQFNQALKVRWRAARFRKQGRGRRRQRYGLGRLQPKRDDGAGQRQAAQSFLQQAGQMGFLLGCGG